jgi:hypothetical protein
MCGRIHIWQSIQDLLGFLQRVPFAIARQAFSQMELQGFALFQRKLAVQIIIEL